MIQEELHNHNNKTSFACSEASWLWKPQTLWMRLSAHHWWNTAQIQCGSCVGEALGIAEVPDLTSFSRVLNEQKQGFPAPSEAAPLISAFACICSGSLAYSMMKLMKCFHWFSAEHSPHQIQYSEKIHTPNMCFCLCSYSKIEKKRKKICKYFI